MTLQLDRPLTRTATRLPRLDEAGRRLMFTHARTANTFSDEPVSDAELRAVWRLAKWPPTAANVQPLRVLFVRTAEAKQRLAAHMSPGNREKLLSAPAVAVLARDTRFHDLLPTVFPMRPGMRDHFESDPEAHEATSSYSAALQAAYFLLAARAEGLATGPMAGFDKAAVDAEFFPDGRWRSELVVNLGHPGEGAWFDRLPRLEDSEVLAWA